MDCQRRRNRPAAGFYSVLSRKPTKAKQKINFHASSVVKKFAMMIAQCSVKDVISGNTLAVESLAYLSRLTTRLSKVINKIMSILCFFIVYFHISIFLQIKYDFCMQHKFINKKSISNVEDFEILNSLQKKIKGNKDNE